MKTIDNREDIRSLVHRFYAKIRKDELLGPIFNARIPEDKWPHHLDKLTDFWETNLFGVAKFKGNPSLKHSLVDASMNFSVSQKHFGQWLLLWIETIDELYEGEKAQRAKDGARKMATRQYLSIWHNRPESQKM